IILAQYQRAKKMLTSTNVFNWSLDQHGKVQGMMGIFGDPFGKRLYDLLVGHNRHLLDEALLIKVKDQIMSGPRTIPSARRGVTAPCRPSDAPGRFGPAANKEIVVLDSRIYP